MSEPCFFCGTSVNPHDLGTWKMVQGWVGGPKKDGLTMRHDAGLYAHDHCIEKQRAGQPADQPDLFGEDTATEAADSSARPEDVEELFGDDSDTGVRL